MICSRPATEYMSVNKIYDLKYLFKVISLVELENILMPWCKILIIHIMVSIFCIVAIGMLTSPFLEAIPCKYLGYCCNLREPLDQMECPVRDICTSLEFKGRTSLEKFYTYRVCFEYTFIALCNATSTLQWGLLIHVINHH